MKNKEELMSEMLIESYQQSQDRSLQEKEKEFSKRNIEREIHLSHNHHQRDWQLRDKLQASTYEDSKPE